MLESLPQALGNPLPSSCNVVIGPAGREREPFGLRIEGLNLRHTYT